MGQAPDPARSKAGTSAAGIVETAADHPDVASIHTRAANADPRISISTVFRTVRLFVPAGILARHRFSDGPSRFETEVRDRHDHLINSSTPKTVAFHDQEVARPQTAIA